MSNQWTQMTQDFQQYSSKMTSINSSKLPAIYNKINWKEVKKNSKNTFPRVLDYGCGRYIDHIKKFTNSQGFMYYPYDPYWMSPEQNEASLLCDPDIIVCSNVLCVIQENKIIQDIVSELLSYGKPVVITVYEGNRSGVGEPTTKGYQRNQTLGEYCLNYTLKTYHGLITTDKNIIL